jgi:heat-inducible transcriptional repressor
MHSDETTLPELTRRQEEILSLIVRTYTQRAEPISSKHLVDAYHLPISSATIRNEMSVLEELGYVASRHTSGGRVPTQNGFRYFVRRLLGEEGELSTGEQTRISQKLLSTPLATENWLHAVAMLLARTAQTAALVTPPIAETNRFKHLELIAIQGRLVLMVLVLQDGAVHQQMLTLAEPLPQPRLSEAADRINTLCLDFNANDVRVKSVQLQLLEREVAEVAADLMDRANSNQVRLVYREGLSDVIGAFETPEGAQQAIRVLEERAMLNMILSDMLTPLINQVQVLIAGEGRWEELKHLSMVLSRYGVPGQFTGAVGVLGPTNLNYGRAISAVSYISGLMTHMLASAYEATPPETPTLPARPAQGDAPEAR